MTKDEAIKLLRDFAQDVFEGHSIFSTQARNTLAATSRIAPDAAAIQADRELDLLDEIECDLPALFGRASIEGHDVGQSLAKEVQDKIRAFRKASPAIAPEASELPPIVQILQDIVNDGFLSETQAHRARAAIANLTKKG